MHISISFVFMKTVRSWLVFSVFWRCSYSLIKFRSSSFIPAAMLLVLVFVGSESPRWLAKKQRYAEAYKVLLRLKESPILAARDLILIRAQLNVETLLFTRKAGDIIDLGREVPHLDSKVYRREISLAGYGRRLTQLFTIPRAQRSTLAAFIVMSAVSEVKP